MTIEPIDYVAELRRIAAELRKPAPAMIGAYDGTLIREAADRLERLQKMAGLKGEDSSAG